MTLVVEPQIGLNIDFGLLAQIGEELPPVLLHVDKFGPLVNGDSRHDPEIEFLNGKVRNLGTTDIGMSQVNQWFGGNIPVGFEFDWNTFDGTPGPDAAPGGAGDKWTLDQRERYRAGPGQSDPRVVQARFEAAKLAEAQAGGPIVATSTIDLVIDAATTAVKEAANNPEEYWTQVRQNLSDGVQSAGDALGTVANVAGDVVGEVGAAAGKAVSKTVGGLFSNPIFLIGIAVLVFVAVQSFKVSPGGVAASAA